MTRQGDEPILSNNEDRLYSIFEFCLKIFLFLSPIFYFGDLQGSFAQSLFFIFGSFGLFCFTLILKPRRQLRNIWIFLFLFWSFLTIFLHGVEIDKISRLAWPIFAISSDGFLYILAGFLLFKIAFCHVRKPERFLIPILLVCIFNLILAILQTNGIDIVYTYRNSICGRMGISSQLGSYSAMTLPIVSFINPFLAVIPLTCLFLAKSFTPIFACFFGFLYFFKIRKLQYDNIIILLLIISIGIYSICNWNGIAARFLARLPTWKQLSKAILQKPVIGWGWKSYLEVVPNLGLPVLERPHQDFGHLALEAGFPILIFLGGYFIGLWRRFKNVVKDGPSLLLGTSILIILFTMSAQTTARYANIMGTWILLLAFLEIKLYDAEFKKAA